MNKVFHLSVTLDKLSGVMQKRQVINYSCHDLQNLFICRMKTIRLVKGVKFQNNRFYITNVKETIADYACMTCIISLFQQHQIILHLPLWTNICYVTFLTHKILIRDETRNGK